MREDDRIHTGGPPRGGRWIMTTAGRLVPEAQWREEQLRRQQAAATRQRKDDEK
ncbi:MAG: hypothetical protein KatS3mg119_1886 [Rhodothalassiaceae bacterium]|nr:MAG: hypothetical protein KatS3mg119_1886 [Rhodothalassiaceae bacterium]